MDPKLYHDHYYDQFDYHHNHNVGQEYQKLLYLENAIWWLLSFVLAIVLELYIYKLSISSKVDFFFSLYWNRSFPFEMIWVQFLKIAKI